ncbi:MAG: hypothetical protein PHQ58_17310 [Rhodoferax sp.]|uniref:hypothetical protein n=1 Tax=Rhodoferax sp. TaxID=50421 RepID=UPI002632578A|nr:hypothetical protein [Rhodoferax sp.]MDD2882186.1 hypothetical protein [Rhodoferax sp.]
MQTLFDAASHIAQEIERTRQHLTNLEQALVGLKPLMTVDAATTTLTFSISSQAQPVEDLSFVDSEAPSKKKAITKSAVKFAVQKAKTTKEKIVVPEAQAEPVKLPATGAELWLKCLGRKKVTVAQLTDAALKKLKLDDSVRNVIGTRAKAWTYSSVKKGSLIEAGMRDGSKLYQLAPANDETTDQRVQGAESVVTAEVAPVAETESAT